MNAATVAKIVSLIPARVARVPSGTLFIAGASPCRYPERLAHLVKFLQWLSPLDVLSKEDQKVLGLLAANGRPMHAGDEEDEAEGADAEEQHVS